MLQFLKSVDISRNHTSPLLAKNA